MVSGEGRVSGSQQGQCCPGSVGWGWGRQGKQTAASARGFISRVKDPQAAKTAPGTQAAPSRCSAGPSPALPTAATCKLITYFAPNAWQEEGGLRSLKHSQSTPLSRSDESGVHQRRLRQPPIHRAPLKTSAGVWKAAGQPGLTDGRR